MQRYPGKDGGSYDSIFEQRAADTRYDQMERLIRAQNNNNGNNNGYYGYHLSYYALSDTNIFQFLLELFILVYPYILSYFIIGYILDESILLMLLLLCITWVTYLPIISKIFDPKRGLKNKR